MELGWVEKKKVRRSKRPMAAMSRQILCEATEQSE